MTRPPPVLLDTTVILRGFWPEQFADDARTIGCADLITVLRANEIGILISVVSIAELLIGDPTRTVPVFSGIEVVSFDRMAARELANMADAAIMKQIQAAGSTRPAVRYDLQIAACAVRHGASTVVSLDGPFRRAVERLRAAGRVSITATEPASLIATLAPPAPSVPELSLQTSMFGLMQQPSPAVPPSDVTAVSVLQSEVGSIDGTEE